MRQATQATKKRQYTALVKNSLLMLAAIGAISTATPALSYEAGDMFVRAGAVRVSPDESSDGIAIPGLDVAAIAGTSAQVDNDTQLGLTFTYMYSNKLGVEVLAASPFEHNLTANLDGHTDGLSVAA